MEQLVQSGTAGPRRKILIAEDNEINREILKELLQVDYDIEEAADGNEAYAILERNYREIAIIVLDLIMPNCDGYQFMQKVNANAVLANVPIVVLTGGYEKDQEEHCLELGAVDFLTKPINPAIIKARLQNIIRMREMAASLNAIELDELTGLYTKQAFYYHARVLLDTNPDVPYEVIISDIENFRLINAAYGRNQGDALLKSLANFIVDHCQDGICARYGVDQIISICRMLSEEEKASYLLAFQKFKKNAPIPNVVLKYGIYQNVDRALPISEICDRAVLALKSVKHNHTRISAMYDGPLSRHQLKVQIYERRFQEAIQNQEFVVWYQPKYDVMTKTEVAAEALVRWKTPDGMIPPGEFLEIFESNGLIGQLDEYVFRCVCQYQQKRKATGAERIAISVNLSRGSLFGRNIVQRYKKIADDCGIDPKDVPIEITESTTVGSQRIKAVADAFYEAGFRLHMDDFGSGHSSLNGLNILHFDVVKLDKSLIDYIGDRNGELILKYTMGLAKELGLQLVAEGVENEKQYDFLWENGCDMIQGYYFSKPLPEAAFEQKIAERFVAAEQNPRPRKKYALMSEKEVDSHAVVRMNHCMPGGFFSYQAFGEERILSSNQYAWNMFGCASEAEFMEYVHGSFRGMVCPEELERVEQSIANQIAGNANNMDYVEYHIVRKDGCRIPIVDYGHLVEQDGVHVFYVFISEAE